MKFNEVLGWHAEGMRFSLFTPTMDLDHREWWKTYTGDEPDTTTSKASTGEHFYQGEFGSGLLELRILPDRIDWILRPNNGVEPMFPSIGEFAPMHHLFIDGLNRWFKSYQGFFTRLAFAVTLLNPVDGRIEGYKNLNEFLPFMPLNKGDWADFYLQFNKPITVNKLEGSPVGINRLINYSVAHMQMMSVQGNLVKNSTFYTRLDLDINTIAEFEGIFTSEDALALSDDLMNIELALKDAAEV